MKTTKILVVNLKGGVGKTTFAFSIAKDLDMNLISNESDNVERLYPKKAKFMKAPKEIDNCVYDFGGFADRNVLKIIKNSDHIIIPMKVNTLSIERTADTLEEIYPHKNPILILITDINGRRQWRDAQKIRDSFASVFKKTKFFFFDTSMIMDNVIDNKISIIEAYEKNKKYKNFYNNYKKVLAELK